MVKRALLKCTKRFPSKVAKNIWYNLGNVKNQDGQVKSGSDGWLELLDYLPSQSPVTQQQRCKSANVHPASFPFGSRIMTP